MGGESWFEGDGLCSDGVGAGDVLRGEVEGDGVADGDGCDDVCAGDAVDGVLVGGEEFGGFLVGHLLELLVGLVFGDVVVSVFLLMTRPRLGMLVGLFGSVSLAVPMISFPGWCRWR